MAVDLRPLHLKQQKRLVGAKSSGMACREGEMGVQEAECRIVMFRLLFYIVNDDLVTWTFTVICHGNLPDAVRTCILSQVCPCQGREDQLRRRGGVGDKEGLVERT